MTPDDIDVWVGLDVGKSAHHAHALDHDGNTLYDKPLKQDEKAIRTMLGKLSKHGRVLLVVDQPNTIGSLPLTVARNMGIAVAYLPGTAMRRTAQLLPGDAKTDRRDAHVIAWAALKLPETLRDAGPDDETLAALKLLAGHDEDLAHESTRHVNRLRSLLLQTHPGVRTRAQGRENHARRDARAARTIRRAHGRETGRDRGREGLGQVQRASRRPHHRRHVQGDRRADRHRARHPHGRDHHPLHRPRHQDDQGPAARGRPPGREAPGGPPSSHGPDVDARDRRQDRPSNILLGIGGDIANFKSSAHLAAYAGISPVTGQSGTSIKGERPSRRGNKRLKNALWQTAFVASTKHPPSVAYYKRKREQGKHHNAAIICLARRRCDVIYSMLKNGTLYQEPALVA